MEALSPDDYDKLVAFVTARYISSVLEASAPNVTQIVNDCETVNVSALKSDAKDALYRKIRAQVANDGCEARRLSNRQTWRNKLDRENGVEANVNLVQLLNTILRDRFQMAGDMVGDLLRSLKEEFERTEEYYDYYDEKTGKGVGPLRTRRAMSVENQLRFLKLMYDEAERTAKLGYTMMKYMGLGKDDDDTTAAQKLLTAEGATSILTNTATISREMTAGPKGLVPRVVPPSERKKIFEELDAQQ